MNPTISVAERKVKLRIGVKHGLSLFPNAGIFVVEVPEENATKIISGFTMITLALRASCLQGIANKFLCEERQGK